MSSTATRLSKAEARSTDPTEPPSQAWMEAQRTVHDQARMELMTVDIRRVESQNIASCGSARKPSSAESGCIDAGSQISSDDCYTRGEPLMKSLTSDAALVFGGKASEMASMQKLQKQLNCEPVLTERSAGWRASLLEPRTRNEYEKLFSADGKRVIFLPTKSNCGTFSGISTPLTLNREKGVEGMADAALYDQDYSPRIVQTPDGTRTFYADGLSSRIRAYDGELKPAGEVDLAATNAEFSQVNDFRCGIQAHYARALSPHSGAETKEFVVALDPATMQPRWSREIECHCMKGIYEAPDGDVYVLSRKKKKDCLQVFSKDGKDKGTVVLGGIPDTLAFCRDGSVIVSGSGLGLRAIKPARLLPGGHSVKWQNEGKGYDTLVPSQDGKSFFAADSSWSGNRLARIDADTGKPIWELKEGSSHLLSFRVIGDEIYTLADSGKSKSAVLTRYDSQGRVVWRDEIPADGVEQWHGGSITPRGDFVFESKEDGSLFFIHPKEDGETKETVQLGLLNTDEVMQKFHEKLAADRESPAPAGGGVEDDDQFVIIDGMKLEKKKSL